MESREKLGIIIVCRMDSTRCPGKTLADVQGKPLLTYVVERAELVETAEIVVATSNRAIDDGIVDLATKLGVKSYRGSAEDVAGRLLDCAQANGFDWFARLNGDSPYLSPSLLRDGIRHAVDDDLDFVTNLMPRSYPYGISCEVLRTSFFRQQYQLFDRLEHFEHATLRLYENIPSSGVLNLSFSTPYVSQIRLTVDTEADLKLFRKMVAMQKKPWRDVHFSEILPTAIETRRVA